MCCAYGSALKKGGPFGGVDFKLVETACGEFRDEQLPDSGVAQHSHLVCASVPVVEIANYTDARSVRRPDGKCNTFGAADLRDVRAELLVDLFVASFAEEMKIDVAKSRRQISGAVS